MTWRVTVRLGPKVHRSSHESLADALDTLEGRCRQAPRRSEANLRYRTFSPGEQVAARGEIAGPNRLLASIRAGVDVRGDGSAQAWTGSRVRREPVDPQPGEDAYAALRRALSAAAGGAGSDRVEP